MAAQVPATTDPFAAAAQARAAAAERKEAKAAKIRA